MKEVHRSNRLVRGALFIAVLFLSAAPGGGLFSLSSPTDIEAHIRVAPDTLLIGDPLTLTLVLVHGKGGELVIEGISPGSSSFDLIEKGELGSSLSGENCTDSLVLALTTYETGELPLGPVSVALKRNGIPDTLQVPAPSVYVRSLLGPQARDLRDIKGLMPVPERARLAWIAILCLLSALAAAFLLWRRRRRKTVRPAQAPIPAEPPHVWALRELAGIERMELPARGRVKEHYVLVSDVLRRYISARHNVETLERTTREILADLAAAGTRPDYRDSYGRVLAEADLVKFARWKPEPAVTSALVPRVRDIVDHTSLAEVEEVVGAVR